MNKEQAENIKKALEAVYLLTLPDMPDYLKTPLTALFLEVAEWHRVNGIALESGAMAEFCEGLEAINDCCRTIKN